MTTSEGRDSMTSATPHVTKRDLETRLIEKAWKDQEFRRNVVTDPKGVLEKQLGRPLPPNLKIFIHEEDANTLHFSIPATPGTMDELSDEELERVAGGTEVAFATALLATVALTVGLPVGTAIGTAAGGTIVNHGW
jgi:hypothetical protein